MSADEQVRSMLGGIGPDIELETHPLTPAPPLSEARVAIVTTAALMQPGEPWRANSHEFRVFDRNELDSVIVGHNSTNFDRSGYLVDRNVVLPLDRLDEMAAEGAIGSVAPRHMAALGSTFELSTFLLDTGPAMAKALREDDVDVVLLTPV